jgi:hypothetical protein
MTSPSGDVDPFPPLPVELVREIMELAALRDTPIALALVLVSKAVHDWVTPIIYRTVVLNTREDAFAFSAAHQADRSSSTLRIFNLAISHSAMRHYDWCLSSCRNVQCLLLNPEINKIESAEIGVSFWPRPWHIVLLGVDAKWFNESLELFSHTTHLYLDEGLYPSFIKSCVSLPLTHICVMFWEDQEDEAAVRPSVELLLSMPSMKMVLVHASVSGYPIEDFFGGVWAELSDIADERLFVAAGMNKDDLIEMFESERTVWDAAEELKDWRHKVQVE